MNELDRWFDDLREQYETSESDIDEQVEIKTIKEEIDMECERDDI